MNQTPHNPCIIKQGNSNTLLFYPDLLNAEYTDVTPGMYSVRHNHTSRGPQITISPVDLNLKDKVLAKNQETNDLVTSLQTIYSPEGKEIYKQCGFTYFTSVLFYGPPGTGKSIQMALIAELIRRQSNGFVFYLTGHIDPHKLNEISESFRRIFPETLFVFILDECEDYLEENLNGWKSLLDSPDRGLDNCLFLLATNFFEEIDESLLRPSRIKYKVEVDKLPSDAIRLFINKWGSGLGPATQERLFTQCVEMEQHLTIDILKHIILDAQIKQCQSNAVMA